MSDLEGLTRRLIAKNTPKSDILKIIAQEYQYYKAFPEKSIKALAEAVYQECINSHQAVLQSLKIPESQVSQVLNASEAGVTMGDGGVGCRGRGDFFVHKLIAQLSETSSRPLISPLSLDDTGAVELSDCAEAGTQGKKIVILSKMEGMHSRLSDFPFLAGFHVTRAALRDIYVKGGQPISLMVDVHLADDGDIGKLFDFQAGIATVAELAGVPITAGSTLRIGGDMVIGDRLTGGVAAVGVMRHNFFRKNIQRGDLIIMTEGAGGGTISTTALYSNQPEVLQETLNIKFLRACENILRQPQLWGKIHAMADVTNGGLRGDLYEINHESGLGAKISPEKVRGLVNLRVLHMLDSQCVDYLGVSLDALLLFISPEALPEMQMLLQQAGVKCAQIGEVIAEQKVVFVSAQGEESVVPRFREAAYTKVKKVVDTRSIDEKGMEERIIASFNAAQAKKDAIINTIRKSNP